MRTRKQLLSIKRLAKAVEDKRINREKFIRQLFRRQGCRIFDKPEQECFRGYNAIITNVLKIGGCQVALIRGCANCKYGEESFNMCANGISKVNVNELPLICRIAPPKDLIWIDQDKYPLKIIPGIYRIPRVKDLLPPQAIGIEEFSPPHANYTINHNVGYVTHGTTGVPQAVEWIPTGTQPISPPAPPWPNPVGFTGNAIPIYSKAVVQAIVAYLGQPNWLFPEEIPHTGVLFAMPNGFHYSMIKLIP